jgi:hypothetical protein
MNGAQWRFVHEEILTMSLMAAFAHVRVYKSGSTNAERRNLQKTLKRELTRLSDEYRSVIGEPQHLENIQNLATKIADDPSAIREDGKFWIGPAQKALNLYLKYLWCFDQIVEPPHCPLDAKILAMAPKRSKVRKVRWTRLEKASDYMECINALRKIAEPKSLTQWECEEFEKGRESNQSSTL